jgi:putative tricarboxylic transport membrane protein
LRANDAVSGLLVIMFAAAMIVLTLNFPGYQGQKFGPALLPRILGVGLIVCGALLILKGLLARPRGEPFLSITAWMRDPYRLTSFLLVLAMLLFYILASETVGFIPIAFVFLAALSLWLRVRPVSAVVTAGVTTLTIYWFFGTVLRVPLPRGWLTTIL